ncbi:MAG: hypothetical protein KDC85_12305 [Saprospiraceae bacterium]|nr:hypothetical protein [Saprospiraceae bacterium]
MQEIKSIEALIELLKTREITYCAFQSLDLTGVTDLVKNVRFKHCLFLGCTFDDDFLLKIQKDNYIFPHLDVPFNAYPSKMYTRETLYNGYDPKNPKSYEKTLDKVIYDYFMIHGKESSNIKETLARRLHDHSITDALYDFLEHYDERKIVAIMGGHGLSRTSENYLKITLISKRLTEKGYLMISGGGPGAMEATHLGAWFAGKTERFLKSAIKQLSVAPTYKDPLWLPSAFEVLEKHPTSDYQSLGIPTWHYGHEPPTPFATHIAKYFANSVREEGLLAVAKGGVIFAPGSAGTIQEVFQDIAQNHYESFGYASPMVFLDKEYWSYDRPIFPIIELMKHRENLENLDLGIYDEIEGVLGHINNFI